MIIRSIIKRSLWGALEPKRTVPLDLQKVQYLFLHYVGAGTTPVGQSAEMAMLRSIQRNHLNHSSIPYTDIAYSFAVGQTGLIYECRGWLVQDGATRRQAGTSLSLCWLGNKEQPSAEALDAIDWWVAEARKRLHRDVPLLGHRQNPKDPGATSCPGDILQRLIDSGRWKPGHREIRTKEEKVEPKVLLRDNQGRIWLCWGIFRKHVATPKQVELLKFVGVQDKTNVDSTELLETLSRVP